MISRGTRRRFSSVALALLATLIIGGIAAPIIVSIQSNRISLASSSLVAAPRDSVIISGPVPVGMSKLVSFDRGTLYPADAAGRALETPLSRSQFGSASTRYAIENGTLRIGTDVSQLVAEQDSPLLTAISQLQFETIYLRKTAVTVLLPDGHTETISDIDGEITQRRKPSLTLSGRGELRGQRVQVEASIGIVADYRSATGAPLKISVKGALAEIVFDGRATIGNLPQVNGSLEVKVGHVRQLGRWFGLAWPSGSGLRNLYAQGQLDWHGPALVMSRTSLTIDDHSASGTLNLNFAAPRPQLVGTLAFKTLDIARYFPAGVSSLPGKIAASPRTILATDLSIPMAQHIDVDLRLSAEKVIAGGLTLGRPAAAITISHGRLLADVAAFEFDGGRGSGQFSSDMNGSVPKVSIRARLENVDSQRISSALFAHPLLMGASTITADLSAQGRTGDDLVLTSAGKLNIGMRSGGKIGVDLKALASSSARQALDGWGGAGKGSIAFDELDAAFSVRAGSLIAEDVKATVGETALSLTGQIDLPTNRLNTTLSQTPMDPRKAAPPTAAPSPMISLQMFGPWQRPSIRNDAGRERAVEPTMTTAPSAARF